jgi:hypothetical protein
LSLAPRLKTHGNADVTRRQRKQIGPAELQIRQGQSGAGLTREIHSDGIDRGF